MKNRSFHVRAARLAVAFALVVGFGGAAACHAQDKDKPADSKAAAAGAVTTTASGLKYEVLVAGKEGGKRPVFGDKVKVHYTGWLENGTKFDSSRDRGEPSDFAIGEVIGGWNEALVLMTPGARWKLTIPPDLAYGPRGRPGIPPNSTLIFDVELLDFQSAPKMPEFHAPDPKTQTAMASGLKYEVVKEGAGDSPSGSDVVEFRFAYWNSKGALLECSEMNAGAALKFPCSELPLAFMKEAVPLLRPGGRLRFEVPAALCFGAQSPGPQLPANSTTVWELELVRVLKPLPIPAFALPDDAKLKATASGLKYEVVEPGEGDSPKMGDHVKVDYAGWLADGTLFDSSFRLGEEADMQLGRVIPGWNEGLQLMKPGAVYRFVIPPALAYGPAGRPPKIPANSTLVFYVKLVKTGG